MRQEFSTSWVSSRQPRKQRKYVYNAPLHIRHRFLNANLSKELRKKHGKRSLPLRKGDEVLIMRGNFADKKGKIMGIDLKKTRVAIENITRTKRDGSKTNVYFHPSNIQIQNLNLDDSRRLTKAKEDNKKEKSQEKIRE